MSDTRRAWTPERVIELIVEVARMGEHLRGFVEAEKRVATALEKALTAPPNGQAEDVDE